MHIIKKIVHVVVSISAVVAIVATTPVFAQTQAVPTGPSPVVISVKNLEVSPTVADAGTTLKGQVTLTNQSDTAAGDIFYNVLLVGNYNTNLIPQSLFGQQSNGPLFFNAHESKVITFTYTLPKTISTRDQGIRVEALQKNGTPTGWADKQIKVMGQLSLLTLVKSSLTIGKQTFALGTGPTVHKGETINLTASFASKAATTTMLTPHIALYERNINGTPYNEYNDTPVSLGAKKTTDISLILPNDTMPANVYAGEVTFTDAQGNVQPQVLNFRYIVGGDIATIQSVSSDKQVLAKNDPFNVTVAYSGTPQDITSSPGAVNATTTKATMSIVVSNENNVVVASQESPIDLTAGHGSQVFPLTAATAAQGISAKVAITKDGKIITSYTLPLSAKPKGILDVAADPVTVALMSAFVGLIIGLIIVARMKKKTNVMLSLVLLLAAGFFGIYSVIHAATYYVSDNNGTTVTVTGGSRMFGQAQVTTDDTVAFNGTRCVNCSDHTINIVTPNSVLSTGSTFNFAGSFQFYACSNTPSDATVQLTFNDPVVYQGVAEPAGYSVTQSVGGDINNFLTTGQFNFGGASGISYSTAGTKTIHAVFLAYVCNHDSNGNCITNDPQEERLEGDFTLNVAAVTGNTALIVNIVGTDGKLIGGGSTQSHPLPNRVWAYNPDWSDFIQKNTNPALFDVIDPGTKTLEVLNDDPDNSIDLRNYLAKYSVCTYTAPATDCTSSTYVDAPLNNGSPCYFDCKVDGISVVQGQTTKVNLMYKPTNTAFLKMYRIVPNGQTLPATRGRAYLHPGATEQQDGDSVDFSENNPLIVSHISTYQDPNPSTFHSADAAPSVGSTLLDTVNHTYTVSYATCDYDSTVANDCTLSAYQTVPMDYVSEDTDGSKVGTAHCGAANSSNPYYCVYEYNIQPDHVRVVYFNYDDGTTNVTTLTGSCTVNPASADKGQNVTWAAANVTGGTPPYTYSWTGSDGWTSLNSSVVRTYGAAGTYTATLNVHSSDGQDITPACPTHTTNNTGTPSGSVVCKPTNPEDGTVIFQAQVGHPVLWIATASDGSAAPAGTYSWSGSENLSGNNTTVTKIYQNLGSKTATVTYNGTPVTCDAATFKVSSQPGYKEF